MGLQLGGLSLLYCALMLLPNLRHVLLVFNETKSAISAVKVSEIAV